ncbi:MAG: HTH-type transcriptional repressor DasR [Firmicutes bacterium]|nr:HTH-type transcriptional repressor DasR [candidate division NPL-UPA2 bacterium]
MHKRGLKPSTRVLSLSVQSVEKKVNLLLGLGAHEDIIVIERLRLADDKPMAFEVAHLPCRRFPGFLALRVDLAYASLYDTLRLHYGIEFARASETLEARVASVREAELLGIPSGAPLLARERTTYGQGDEPIEHVKSLYRADRYRFMYEVTK